MLSDFLLLEVYFGSADGAQDLEKAYRAYGRKAVQNALKAGDLVINTLRPLDGRVRPVCWLSDSGRQKAQTQL